MSTIRFVDESGHALPDVGVLVCTTAFEDVCGTVDAPLRSDESGEVTLARTTSAPYAWVVAWKTGRAGVVVALERALETGRVELAPSTALRGRVDGGGVRYVWLSSVAARARWPLWIRCEVAADGRFRVDGVSAGAYAYASRPDCTSLFLDARADGSVRLGRQARAAGPTPSWWWSRSQIVADGSEHAVARVLDSDARGRRGAGSPPVSDADLAPRPREVRGRVVDRQGRPLSGVRVHLLPVRGGDVDVDGRQVLTDVRGRFAFRRVLGEAFALVPDDGRELDPDAEGVFRRLVPIGPPDDDGVTALRLESYVHPPTRRRATRQP